jgi:hypothetical protein
VSKGDRDTKDHARDQLLQLLGKLWRNATRERPKVTLYAGSRDPDRDRFVGTMKSAFGRFLLEAAPLCGYLPAAADRPPSAYAGQDDEPKHPDEALKKAFERAYNADR